MQFLTFLQSGRADLVPMVVVGDAVVGAAFLAVAVLLFVFAVGVPVRGWLTARRAVPVTATVLSADVRARFPLVERLGLDDLLALDPEYRVRGRATHTPTVSYRYVYGGRQYESSTLYANGTTVYESEPSARQHLADFTPGESVTAFVDPETPERAFLRRSAWLVPTAIAGVVALALGAVGVFFLL